MIATAYTALTTRRESFSLCEWKTQKSVNIGKNKKQGFLRSDCIFNDCDCIYNASSMKRKFQLRFKGENT